MKVLFMGTPDFAVPCLESIIKSENNNVIGVVTQPDKPKGRGHKLQPTPVKAKAVEYNIPVFQPETLKNRSFEDELKQLNPDIIVVVAYGQILPEYILNFPKFGCINVHASLLPKYRGAAPIQWSVINGDTTTGVTTMYMAKSLDTGDMIQQAEIQIGDEETAGELHDRLSLIGADLIVETIKKLSEGKAIRVPQNDSLSSYAPMLNKETGHIDWNKNSSDIINLIRGTNPWPGAFTSYKSEIMKIYKAYKGNTNTVGKPGEIIGIKNKKIEVCCGNSSSILIDEIQFKGGKRMNVSSYLNGHSIDIGEILN